MASQGCEVKRIQVNSAQQALDLATQGRDSARTDYLACLGPQEQGSAAISDAQPTIDRIKAESGELYKMNEVLLQMLGREAQASATVADLATYTEEETTSLRNQIDELKSSIRTERRKFLDASPSVSPAVGGLYFTQTPDNKVLIAFMSCLGAFLVLVSALVMLNLIPPTVGFGNFVFANMTGGERGKLVAIFWVVSLVIAWLSIYLFT
jgi:hypothetical protein